MQNLHMQCDCSSKELRTGSHSNACRVFILLLQRKKEPGSGVCRLRLSAHVINMNLKGPAKICAVVDTFIRHSDMAPA